MNNNDKNLLKLFDIDDDSIQSFLVDFDNNRYIITIKFYPVLNSCPHCGSVHFHCQGNYIKTFSSSPINNFICKVRTSVKKYKCIDCGSYFIEDNPIAYKGKSFTKTAVICILQDLKPYTSTYSSVARRYDASVTKIIDVFTTLHSDRKKKTA